MFRGHILKFKLKKSLKNHSTEKKNQRKAGKGKAGQEENANFVLISKLLSDGEIPVKKVNVVNLLSLKGTLACWLD